MKWKRFKRLDPLQNLLKKSPREFLRGDFLVLHFQKRLIRKDLQIFEGSPEDLIFEFHPLFHLAQKVAC